MQVTQEIYARLGESYMILVPETIPFLAEVLEGESNWEIVESTIFRQTFFFIIIHGEAVKFSNVRSKKLMIFLATDLVVNRLILKITA